MKTMANGVDERITLEIEETDCLYLLENFRQYKSLKANQTNFDKNCQNFAGKEK